MSPSSPHAVRRGPINAWRRAASRLLGGTLLAAVALLGGAEPAVAHEIPARVAARVLVRADGDSLRVLLRVPLATLRDLEVPPRPDGTLDPAGLRDQVPLGISTHLLPALRFWVPTDGGARALQPRIADWRVTPPSGGGYESVAEGRRFVGVHDVAPADELRFETAWLDVALVYAVPSGRAGALRLTPSIASLGVRTSTVVGVERAEGTRLLRFDGDPGEIALQPTWYGAAWRFLVDGVGHILGGIDHLLFLAVLVLPVRGWRPIVAIATAFTVGHSITLIAAATGAAPTAGWFPPLVECLIAASIVYAACENLLASPAALARRWRLAFAFGLVHGFGFAFALGDALQFAGPHLVPALAAFNVGVEVGQLGVLLLVVPLLALVRARLSPDAILGARGLVIVGSLLVAHTAWHWMTERWDVVRAYTWTWPTADAALLAGLLRIGALATIAALGGLLVGAIGRWLERRTSAAPVGHAVRPVASAEGHGAPQVALADRRV